MTDEMLYLAGDFQAIIDRHSAKMREFLVRCYPEADTDHAMRRAFADLRRGAGYLPQYHVRPWFFSRAAFAAVEMIRGARALQSVSLVVY